MEKFSTQIFSNLLWKICKEVGKKELMKLKKRKAYIVANFTVNDSETFKKYLSVVGESINKFKGKYIVRSPLTDILEGEPFKFLAIVEFNSKEIANTWFNSEDYQKIIDMRISSTEGWFVIADEFSPPK